MRSDAEQARPPHGAALLEQLDRRYRRPLMTYFEKRLREHLDVDDLVQEVFVRLAQRARLENIEFFEGYVFRTAASVMRDRVRRRVVRHAGDHEPLDEALLPTNDLSPERVLQGTQLLGRAIEALRALPERTRQVFVLRRYEDMKYEDIAASLGMSVEGVRFHLRRAKVHLALRMEQDT